MEKKESGKISLYLCFILVILTALVVGILVYTLAQTEKDSIINEEKTEELDIKSELVESLNNKTVKYNNLGAIVVSDNQETDYFDSSFYKDTKVEYTDLSNEEKIVAVINNIIPKEVYATEIDTSNFYPIYREAAHFENNSNIKLYTKEQLEESAKKVFGENATDIKWETLDMCGSILDYVDGNYYEYSYEGGGLGYTDLAASKVVKAEKQGDYIYIYDKFLYCDELEYWAEGGDEKFYTSASKINELKDVQLLDYKEYYGADRLNKILDDNLGICPTYKHTFKMDNKGNCYWISSEPIE